jgi:putative DNA primase/helicase
MSNALIPVSTWPDLVQYGKDAGKKPASTIGNLLFLLSKLGIAVKYNVISKDLEITDPNGFYGTLDGGKNAAVNGIISLACKYGMPKGDIAQYLKAIGYQNQYNPVLDWIKSKRYDHDLNYIDLLCETVTPRPDFPDSFKKVLIKKWLISCVALLCNDNADNWSKGVLTFQGAQNAGKTSWFWKLFPQNHKEWGEESLVLNPADKDSVTTAIRNWIVELGELGATFKKADIDRIKGFITKKSDTLRLPYDRSESSFPRRTSFFASVNPSQFLRDTTGNARFWVIPVVEINYQHNIDIQQVWAQALDDYYNGVKWFLDHEESKILDECNESARETSAIEEMILARVPFGQSEMTATQVLQYLGYERPTGSDVRECSTILRKLYGDPFKTRSGRYYRMI